MDAEADANRIIFEPRPEFWRRPLGWQCSIWLGNVIDDLACFDMRLLELEDAASSEAIFLEAAGFI